MAINLAGPMPNGRGTHTLQVINQKPLIIVALGKAASVADYLFKNKKNTLIVKNTS